MRPNLIPMLLALVLLSLPSLAVSDSRRPVSEMIPVGSAGVGRFVVETLHESTHFSNSLPYFAALNCADLSLFYVACRITHEGKAPCSGEADFIHFTSHDVLPHAWNWTKLHAAGRRDGVSLNGDNIRRRVMTVKSVESAAAARGQLDGMLTDLAGLGLVTDCKKHHGIAFAASLEILKGEISQ